MSRRSAPASPRRGWWIRIALVVLLAIPVVLLLSWPQVFGAQRAPGVAQLIAFRAALAIGFGVLALATAVVALLLRSRGAAAVLAVILAGGAVANAVTLGARGSGGALSDGDLTVLAWNTQLGATSAQDVADLVAEVDADIVTLPETDAEAVAEIARVLADAGRPMAADTMHTDSSYPWIETSVLIAGHLGAYREDTAVGPAPGPSGVWVPVDGDGPTIVAAHTVPPLPDTMDTWQAGLRWIADRCDHPDVIVAGDLNATVDHLTGLGTDGHLLGTCDDTALAAGAGAAGTWPSNLPGWLAAPIDHVLTGPGWTVRGVRAVDVPAGGGDHRALVTVLVRG